MSDSAAKCATCYGTGEVVTEQGPVACPDCFGEGRALAGGASIEWRLRELEGRYGGSTEADPDVKWLLHELRAARESLVRILTLCHDADAGDALAREIKYQANEALRIYAPETD